MPHEEVMQTIRVGNQEDIWPHVKQIMYMPEKFLPTVGRNTGTPGIRTSQMVSKGTCRGEAGQRRRRVYLY